MPMRGRAGFTLVEMMVLVGIFGLVVALAIPNVASYVRSNQLDTSVDRMAADLNLARTMSITNGRIFRLTTTEGGYRLVDTISGEVLRNRSFEGDVALDAADSAQFFPWGMAEAKVFNLKSSVGDRSINLLPTGVVEVQ
jgi:type II secretion system protein H